MSPHKIDTSPAGGGSKNNAQMFQIFQNVQFNMVQHKKYVKELTKLYKKCQCVSGQSVRYRASQLLAAVLAALGDDASLDDDLCDKLLSSQMERLQDTRGAVRCRAALALQRLQNPMEPDDPVTRAYRFHMSCDPNSSVRRAIVQSIAKCTRNLPFVLERLCDVDEAVRRAAFLYVSVVNVTQLKVRQRVHTLKVGLTERSARVRRVVEEVLVPGWLATFKGNIIELMTAVRLDNATGAEDSQYVTGKLLESLFKRLPVSELLEWLPTERTLRLIPAEQLNKETARYWRHLAEHLVRCDDDETLEQMLPDLLVMTSYIRAILESPCPSPAEDPVGFSTRQCVLHELATMLRVYDAGDEVGRSSLQQLLFDALTGDHGPLNEEVIGALVSALALVLPEVSRRVEFVSSVVSELREPSEPEPPPAPPAVSAVDCTETKLQRARLRVSLNVAMEAQEEAAAEQNYALAAECKARVESLQRQLDELGAPSAPAQPPPPPPPQVVREKSDDPAVLNKCLLILNFLLDSEQVTSVTPLLKLIFSELEVEIFQNPELLENALKTVALYGILDEDFAKEHKAFFFANMVELDNERVVCTVLRCVLDLLCVHGARLFEEEVGSRRHDRTDTSSIVLHDGDTTDVSTMLTATHGTVIEVLLKAMDSQCGAYRLIVVEGLCRLLMLGHLESPAILSRLLLLWFSPATEEEELLRQTIGVFFQTFATSVDGAQDQIQEATLPTLKALANAPVHSPLAEIDQDAVVRFIVSLTRVQQEMSDSQGAMALLLVSQLVKHKGRPVAALLCKCLALLQPPREPRLCADLAGTLRNILLELPDKTSARNVSRYLGSLEAAERVTFNKTSTMATINELSGMTDDNASTCLGRATSSLPAHPIARSTHIVVNETLEEEIEIDETSPTEADQTNNRNSETNKLNSDAIEQTSDKPGAAGNKSSVDKSGGSSRRRSDSDRVHTVAADRTSDGRRRSGSDRRVTLVRGSRVPDNDTPVPRLSLDAQARTDVSGVEALRKSGSPEDSSGGSESSSPRKRPRVGPKGSRKKATKAAELTKQAAAKTTKASSSLEPGHEADKGIKRTRSQRSIVDLDRGSPSPASPAADGRNSLNVTPKPSGRKNASPETPVSALRRSSRSLHSSSSPDSGSSRDSAKTAASGKSTKAATKSKSDSGPSQKSTRSAAGKSTKASSVESSSDSSSSQKTVKSATANSKKAASVALKPGKSLPSAKSLKSVKNKSGKASNTPVRGTRSSIRSGRSSGGANSDSEVADSADETELHTIVYDNEMEQSLMSASSDEEGAAAASKANVTIPETPESSERSGCSSEDNESPAPAKTKSTKAKK